MLNKNEIEKIKIKMLKKGINQTKLSNLLGISNTSLTFALKRTKNFPNVEDKLKIWLYSK